AVAIQSSASAETGDPPIPRTVCLHAARRELVDEVTGEPEGGGGEVDDDPGLAPGLVDRGLQQIARGDHGEERERQGGAAPAPRGGAGAPAAPDVAAPDEAGGEDEERRREDVEVLRVRLPGVVDDGVGIRRLQEVEHPGVDEPGAADERGPRVEEPELDAA